MISSMRIQAREAVKLFRLPKRKSGRPWEAPILALMTVGSSPDLAWGRGGGREAAGAEEDSRWLSTMAASRRRANSAGGNGGVSRLKR